MPSLLALLALLVVILSPVPPVVETPPPPMGWAVGGGRATATWAPPFAADGWRVLLVRPEGAFQLSALGPSVPGDELRQLVYADHGRFFPLRLCAQWSDDATGAQAERCWDYSPSSPAGGATGT